jgi:rRNA processing protein Gar1
MSKGGNLIIRGGEMPSLYSTVGTKDAKIGKVTDVIGPVSKPYIVVKPSKKLSEKEFSSLKGKIFYEYRRRYFGKKGRVH